MSGAAARLALSRSGTEEEPPTTQFTVFSGGAKFNSLQQAKEGKTYTFEMSGCLFCIFSLASFLMFSFYIFLDFFSLRFINPFINYIYRKIFQAA